MILQVKVVPNASEDQIEKVEEGKYKVWTTEAPVKGRANKAVQKILAKYFNVHAKNVEVHGLSRTKRVEIKIK